MNEASSIAEMAALGELGDVLAELIGVKIWTAETNLKLERIERLLKAAGSPQHAYPHVHVGGTSGKGTVAAMTAAVLCAHGLTVGLHVSPYVQVVNETWQLNGRNATPSRVLELAQELRSLVAADQSPYGPASYFEFKVALAFALFRSAKVDVAVVEVGLGGTLDATNVLDSGVKVLTNVGLDHTEILGDTVEEIAGDKMGIFRPGGLVICGATQPTVRQLVKDRCRKLGTPLWLIDDSLLIRRTESGMHLEMVGKGSHDILLPEGWPSYKVVSAGLAVAASVQMLGEELDSVAIARALESVALPGRVEWLERDGRTAVLDGAHNEDKVAASLASIRAGSAHRKRVGVVALKQGKDATKLVPLMAAALHTIIFTTFDAPPWSCVPPEDLAQLLEKDSQTDVVVEDHPMEAVRRAETIAGLDGVVVVIGSFYLVGNVRAHWVSNDDAALRGGSFQLPGHDD